MVKGDHYVHGSLVLQEPEDAPSAPVAGAIRYNKTDADFEGYDGTAWRSLTVGSGSGSVFSGATVQGSGNTATGLKATAWGSNNRASSLQSTAWGGGNTSSGILSTVWGSLNLVSGTRSTAWGYDNAASSHGSTVWGLRNTSSGDRSTAWGIDNTSNTFGSTAWGSNNVASGTKSTAWGIGNTASKFGSTAWGSGNTSRHANTTVWGKNNTASGTESTAWGTGNTSNNSNTTVWGKNNSAISSESTAWGNMNTASGYISTVWGDNNSAAGTISSTWGSSNTASGEYSTAWGQSNTASGVNSAVWGWSNTSEGQLSTAWGGGNTPSGLAATAWGGYNKAESFVSTAFGMYNIGGYKVVVEESSWANGDNQWFDADPLLEIGASSDKDNRANALTLLKNGRIALGKHTTLDDLQTRKETVQIEGALLLGDYANAPDDPTPGAIRYNNTDGDFQGYKGEDDGWVSLTTSSPNQANVKAALGIDANANVLTASANGQVSLPSSLTVSTKVVAKVGDNILNTPGIFTAGEHWGLDSHWSNSLFVSESFGHPTYRRNPNRFGFLYSISSDNTTGPSEPGLVLYNNHAVAGAWSPLIAFGNREVGNTPYNSATAGIAARTPRATTSDGHWSDGELHFFTSGDSTHGLRKRVVIDKDGNLGVGVFSLTERLHVDGALVLGDTATTTPGAIRYNSTDADFEGYKGEDAGWVSLTTSDAETVQSASSLVVPGSTTAKLSVDANGRVLLAEAQGDIPMFGQ